MVLVHEEASKELSDCLAGYATSTLPRVLCNIEAAYRHMKQLLIEITHKNLEELSQAFVALS
jgi:hypothetical protein